jgi:hypothetical protein
MDPLFCAYGVNEPMPLCGHPNCYHLNFELLIHLQDYVLFPTFIFKKIQNMVYNHCINTYKAITLNNFAQSTVNFINMDGWNIQYL